METVIHIFIMINQTKTIKLIKKPDIGSPNVFKN